jgi:hypothetical protein
VRGVARCAAHISQACATDAMLRPSLLLAGLGLVSSHGALISPMPRNAVDRFLPGYAGGHFGNASCGGPLGSGGRAGNAPPKSLPRGQYGPPSGNGSCWGCNCVNGTQPCEVAQTCVWFTEGTSIGCAKPSGTSPSPSPHCTPAEGLMNATNNDARYRTMLLDVEPLSKDDHYRWNPWRAPGQGRDSSFSDSRLTRQRILRRLSTALPLLATCHVSHAALTSWQRRFSTRAGWRVARQCGATRLSPSTIPRTPSRVT